MEHTNLFLVLRSVQRTIFYRYHSWLGPPCYQFRRKNKENLILLPVLQSTYTQYVSPKIDGVFLNFITRTRKKSNPGLNMIIIHSHHDFVGQKCFLDFMEPVDTSVSYIKSRWLFLDFPRHTCLRFSIFRKFRLFLIKVFLINHTCVYYTIIRTY